MFWQGASLIPISVAMTNRRFMKEKYTPVILSIPGKIAILLGTVALFAAGIYGVTQVKRGRKG